MVTGSELMSLRGDVYEVGDVTNPDGYESSIEFNSTYDGEFIKFEDIQNLLIKKGLLKNDCRWEYHNSQIKGDGRCHHCQSTAVINQ